MKPVVSCKNGTQSFFFIKTELKEFKGTTKIATKKSKKKKFNP